jgi:hypothetical protein
MLKSIKLKSVFLFIAMLGTVGLSAQTEAKKVTDKELNNFADAFQEVQMENQSVQQEMMTMIKEKGLDVNRFQEIQQSQMDPNSTVEVSEKEMIAFKSVMSKIEAMQPELQAQMEAIIKKKGLSLERYQEVAAAIQSDADLQQKLQTIMMKKQTGMN